MDNTEKSIKIRKLQRNDKDNYLFLMRQLSGYDYSPTQFQWDMKYVIVSPGGLLFQYSNVYCAWIEKQMVGTYKILYEPKFGQDVVHIEDVVVDSEWRNKGIGTYMIKNALNSYSGNKDVYKISLNCSKDNGAFYEKLGFKKEGYQYKLFNSL